jgi:hypothetical protein
MHERDLLVEQVQVESGMIWRHLPLEETLGLEGRRGSRRTTVTGRETGGPAAVVGRESDVPEPMVRPPRMMARTAS